LVRVRLQAFDRLVDQIAAIGARLVRPVSMSVIGEPCDLGPGPPASFRSYRTRADVEAASTMRLMPAARRAAFPRIRTQRFRSHAVLALIGVDQQAFSRPPSGLALTLLPARVGVVLSASNTALSPCRLARSAQADLRPMVTAFQLAVNIPRDSGHPAGGSTRGSTVQDRRDDIVRR